ncbi:MAG: glycerophosphodiester phosphodiesterase [Candidatus Binatia bacterium]
MTYFAPPRPRILGHRGAAGVAPENTLPSFAVAAAFGAEYLELDVHATRDGEVVVLHDALLDRTTDGSGPVRDRTWSEVAQLDAGCRFSHDQRSFPFRGQGVRVPRLQDVLRACAAHRLNIEIKQGEPPIAEAVLELLQRERALARCLLTAEHDDIMAEIRRAAADRVATGLSAGEVLTFLDRVRRADLHGYVPPGHALQVPPAFGGVDIITPASIAAAHQFGLEVHAWTINDGAEIARLLELGVDGIVSDLPGLAIEVARQHRGA